MPCMHLADDNEPFNQMFKEGTFWALWVTNIGSNFEAKWPSYRREKRFCIKDNRDRQNLFFSFFEMQKHIPVESRRHMPAANAKDQKIYLDALSQAISRARHSNSGRGVLLIDALRNLLFPAPDAVGSG